MKLRWSGNVKLMGINSSLGKMKAGSLELSKEHLFLINSIISAMKVLFKIADNVNLSQGKHLLNCLQKSHE